MSLKRFTIKISRWLTLMTLLGLVLGMVLGFNYTSLSSINWVFALLEIIEGLGFVWVNLLQLVAIPLIVFLIWNALVTSMDRNLGRMGIQTILVIVIVLIAGAIFINLIIHPVLDFIPRPESHQVDVLKRSMSFESGSADALIWKQFFHSLFNNDVLSFLKKQLWIWLLLPVVFTFVPRFFSVKRPLSRGRIEQILHLIFKVIGWLLQIVPVAAMGLSYAFTRSLGYALTGVVVYLILGGCVVICLYMGLQLLSLLVIGRMSLARLFQVLKNPYLVAMSSRSSLATLPVLAEETDRFLHLRNDVTGFVFPFSATFLKITSPVSSGFKLFFVAHIFHIDLGWQAIVIFFLSLMFISFLTQGIPTEGNASKGIPLFVAAGVPAEGFILAKSFFTIPDIFETMSNVTGYLIATVTVNRIYKPILPKPVVSSIK